MSIRIGRAMLLGLAAIGVRQGAAQTLRPLWDSSQDRVARHQTRSAEACVGVAAPPDGTPADSSFFPVEAKSIVLPTFDGLGSLDGKTVSTRFYVDRSGSVQRVQLDGLTEGESAKKLRATLMRYEFNPAVYHGCVVEGTYRSSLTFGAHATSAVHPTPDIIGRTWPARQQEPWVVQPGAQSASVSALPPGCAPRRLGFTFGEWPDPRAAHGAGRVTLQFVIDSSGVPVDSTVRVAETSGPAFTAAVKKSFGTLHYEPAWCDGGHVAMYVQQRFLFTR